MGGHAKGRLILRALSGALLGGLWPLAGFAFANVEVGQQIENEELPTLDGSREMLLSRKAIANVFVFFRSSHDRSLKALRAMAACEKEFAGKPVRWVAVVSDSQARDEVRAVVAAAGIHMPVLVDEGDRLYGKLGVRLHPVVGIADDKGTLLDYLPFHQINYCDMIRVRIRHALAEVDLAAVERIDNPPKALFPNAVPGAVAKRRVKLGEMFLESRQWTKAVEQARIALEKEPALVAAHALMGRALAGQGKCDEALSAFEQALRLDPRSASALEGRMRCGATTPIPAPQPVPTR
jgi:tetratricopeptide (TPR) repeat protein